MNHLPKDFQEKTHELQNTIVELGLHSWSLIEHYIDQQKHNSIFDLTTILKEKLNKQKEKELEQALQQKDKEYENIIKDLTFELDNKETKYKKTFDEEKKLLTDKIRLDVAKEFQEMRDEYMSLKATLKAQGDFQTMCMKFNTENNILREQIAKFTETKSSADIGTDGEDEIELLLDNSGYEFENQAKKKGGHKGDFHIKPSQDKTFILDSKKYSKNVPKAEKDKIMEDVDRDASINGGLLVSLKSGIANQQNGDIIITNKNKPILFLSLAGLSFEAKQAILRMMIKQLHKYTILHEEKEKQDLMNKIECVITGLDKIIKRYTNMEVAANTMLTEAKNGKNEAIELLKIFRDK